MYYCASNDNNTIIDLFVAHGKYVHLGHYIYISMEQCLTNITCRKDAFLFT